MIHFLNQYALFQFFSRNCLILVQMTDSKAKLPDRASQTEERQVYQERMKSSHPMPLCCKEPGMDSYRETDSQEKEFLNLIKDLASLVFTMHLLRTYCVWRSRQTTGSGATAVNQRKQVPSQYSQEWGWSWGVVTAVVPTCRTVKQKDQLESEAILGYTVNISLILQN